MDILVSGQAGAAVSIRGQVAEVWLRDSEQSVRVSHRRVNELLQGCGDVRPQTVRNNKEAAKAAAAAWAADRALWLALMLLDHERSASLRKVFAEELNHLLAEHPHCLASVKDRLGSHALDGLGDLEGAAEFSAGLDHAIALLDWLRKVQPYVSVLRTAFDALPAKLFVETSRAHYLDALVAAGAFSSLAERLAEEADVSFSVLKLQSDLRHLNGVRELISLWAKGFGREIQMGRRRAVQTADLDWNDNDLGDGRSGEAFAHVSKQLVEITRRLTAGDELGARRYVSELVEYQKQSGDAEYLAKTLCNLGQRAKRLGNPELHLEWTEAAVAAKPDDAWAAGQYADALIYYERFTEAAESLQVAQTGYPSFAATNLARILRKSGHLQEALDAYLAAREEYADAEDAHFAWTGVAEVYRDLGDNHRALIEYEAAEENFPSVSAVLAGKASVLSDLGRFGEALQYYGRALVTAEEKLVPLNGRAAAYRDSGQLDRSATLYAEIEHQFPNDPAAFCGRAEVFRLAGRFQEAEALYKSVAERFRLNPVPVSGLINVFLDTGRLNEAEVVLKKMRLDFPEHSVSFFARARLYRAKGMFKEALAVYEQLLTVRPYDHGVKLSQASMLARLGDLDRAIIICKDVLSVAVRSRSALNLLASIKIRLGEYDEAAELLVTERLSFQSDWTALLLRAILRARTGTVAHAAAILQSHMRNVPYARERRMLASALAILRLRLPEVDVVRGPEELILGEVGSIVQLHVDAAARNQAAARVYERLRADTPDFYGEVREEIAKRFKVIEGGAAHSQDWLFEAESEMILAEAA